MAAHDATDRIVRRVLVPVGGRLRPGTVLWTYDDTGRERALVRYASVSGVVVRRLHWADELRPDTGRVIELPVHVAGAVPVRPRSA